MRINYYFKNKDNFKEDKEILLKKQKEFYKEKLGYELLIFKFLRYFLERIPEKKTKFSLD